MAEPLSPAHDTPRARFSSPPRPPTQPDTTLAVADVGVEVPAVGGGEDLSTAERDNPGVLPPLPFTHPDAVADVPPSPATYAARGASHTRQRVRYKFPWRQALLAAFLLIVGVVMTIVGLLKSLAILFVGVLAFLPGAYQTYVLYMTYKRKPGYRVEETYEMVEL